MKEWRNRIVGHDEVDPKDLTAHPQNWRKHPKEQRRALDTMMERIGWVDDVIVNRTTGRILDGHLRVEMAIKHGGKVPVKYVEMSEEEEKETLLTFDPIGAMAERDEEILDELAKATRIPEELLIDLAITEPDALKEGKTDPDDVPEPPEEPITKPGDLWLLGEHRLLCGDSTKAEDVKRVMGNEKARLMNTDPPYGVAYDNSQRPNPGVAKPRVAKPRVANDELVDGPRMQAFLEDMLNAAAIHMDDKGAYYFWHPMLTQGTYVAAAAAAGILIHRQIIWVKPVMLLGRGDYHWKHELCFYGWRRGNRPEFYGRRNQTTIWEVGNITQAERRELDHATPKPVELFTRPLENNTVVGDICYEPFCGSGPQIIAAEQLGRRCYAIELEPKYVDVAVRRWEQFTGKKATRE